MNINLLKEELERRGMNQLDLATKCGLTPSTISRIFNGQRGCSVETAKKIVDGLKLKPKPAMSIFFEDNDAESQQ